MKKIKAKEISCEDDYAVYEFILCGRKVTLNIASSSSQNSSFVDDVEVLITTNKKNNSNG